MIFVNMKADRVDGRIVNRGKGIPFMETEDCSGQFFVNKEDNVIELDRYNSIENTNIFGNRLFPDEEKGISDLFRGDTNTVLSRLTYADIRDTDDNPILVVYCDSIGIFKNVPAIIKFLYMGSNGVLAALIAGACQFNGVVLERCFTSPREDAYKKVARTFHGSDLKDAVVGRDARTGYDYLNNTVFEVQLMLSSFADGSTKMSMKTLDRYYLDGGEGVNKAQEVYEAGLKEAQRQAELKKLKYEAEAQATAKRRAEEEEKARIEKERKAEARANRKANSVSKRSNAPTRNVSASDFLEAVRQIQNQQKG